MNNLRKIICAVLVFALLCGTLVFATSAETTGSDFTPGRTLASVNNRVDPLASTAEGNLFVQFDNFNAAANYKLIEYLVSDAGSDDQYWLSRVESDGESFTGSGHSHLNLYVKESIPAEEEGGAPDVHFGHVLKAGEVIVYETDMYFEDAMLNGLYVNLNMRNATGDNGYGGSSLSSAQDRALAGKLPVGEWFHLTAIGDVDNDVVYWYLNGEYIQKTDKGVSGGVVAYENKYVYYGVRWQINNANVNHGQSIAFDNIFTNIITTEDLGEFTMGAENLDNFAQAQPYTLREVVPVAIVDGVEYDTVAEVNAVLAEALEPVEVELLRDFNSALVVNCDATINTNGINSIIKAPSNVKVSNVGNVYTYDAPYVGTQKDTEKVSQTDFLAAVRYDAADNQLKTAGLSFCGYNAPYDHNGTRHETYHIAYTAINTQDKNVFGMVQPYGMMGSQNSYIDMKLGENGGDYHGVYYSEDAKDGYYVVVEFDAARLGDVFALPAYIVARETNDTNGTTATKWSAQYDMGNAVFSKLPEDGFGHVTVVAVANENKGYFYIDGALVATANNFFFNEEGFNNFKNGQRVMLDSFRFGGNTNMPMAYDNMYLRVMKGADAGNLVVLAGTNNITTWDKGVYNEDYVVPTLPVLATVDGVDVYNTAAITSKLVGENVVTVEMKKNIYTATTVNGNVIINTNSLVANFVPGESATMDTSVENTIKFTIPYIPAYTANKVTGGVSAILNGGGVSGGTSVNNAYQYFDGVKTEFFDLYEIFPTTGGDSYFKISPIKDFTVFNNTEISPETGKVQGAQNPFVGYSVGKALDMEGYYVIDFDIATEGEHVNMTLNPTIRNVDENGTVVSGKYPDGTNISYKNFIVPSNQWTHVTVIGDMANNVSYLFVDGKLVNANYGYAYRTDSGNYLGGGLKFDSIRFNYGNGGNSIKAEESTLLNNLAARVYSGSEKAVIDALVEAKSLADWSESLYEGNKQLPGIITIDGAPYGNSVVASEALSVEGEDTYNVSFKADFEYPVTIGASAVVDTNGIGAYKVAEGDPVEAVIEDEAAIIYAPFAVEVDEEVVTVTTITEDNAYIYADCVYWVYGFDEDDNEIYEAVYYPIGTAITYYGTNDIAKYGNYIVDGTLTSLAGWLLDGEGEYVTDFGVATGAESYIYYMEYTTAPTEITLPDAMYNLSLSTDYKINLFVPKAIYTGDATRATTAGGVEYIVLTQGVAATEIANAVEFLVTYTIDGVEYTEVVEVSVLDYAEAVMASDYSKMLKRTIMAALNYSETAIEELLGEQNQAIKEILDADANAEFVTIDTENYGDSTDITKLTFLCGGKVHVGANPEFVFTVRQGYAGTIIFTYEGVEGKVTVTKEVDATEAEVDVVLENVKIYDVNALITITYVPTEGDEVVGEYTLGTYINELANSNYDSATAKALYVYSDVANVYKNACIEASKEA